VPTAFAGGAGVMYYAAAGQRACITRHAGGARDRPLGGAAAERLAGYAGAHAGRSLPARRLGGNAGVEQRRSVALLAAVSAQSPGADAADQRQSGRTGTCYAARLATCVCGRGRPRPHGAERSRGASVFANAVATLAFERLG